MFGAGWTEMLIIGVVALIVIGPKDLPVVMQKLGRMVRTVRRMGDEFQRELNKTTGLDQIADLRRSITEPLTQTRDEIVREFNRQTATGVEPSGLIKPTDPAVESVYDQITAASGITAETPAPAVPVAPPPVMKPMAGAEPLPAPAEASLPTPVAAAKPKARRAAKSTASDSSAPKPARRRAAPKPAASADDTAPKRATRTRGKAETGSLPASGEEAVPPIAAPQAESEAVVEAPAADVGVAKPARRRATAKVE